MSGVLRFFVGASMGADPMDVAMDVIIYLSPLRGSGGEPDCFLTCILNIMK